MDLLESLLADAEAEVAAARGKRRAATPSGHFVESDFSPVGLIAMMNRMTCHRCGATHLALEGLFEERAHKRRPTELHMVRLPFIPPASTLPKHRRFMEHALPYCSGCVTIEEYKE